MAKKIEGKNVAKNMILSVTAQLISMIIGFVLNLVVPKFIGEHDYAYWQTYILYSQYVCFLQFGLLDGFVLKYSKYDYDELNKDSVRSQYLVIMLLDIFCMLCAGIAAFAFLEGVPRVILLLLAITIPTEVTYNYVSFTFQTTNRIKEYAKCIIVYRTIYCVSIIVLLLAGRDRYYWFCGVYIVSNTISSLYYGLRYSRSLFVGKFVCVGQYVSELKNTISAGIWLMLSSYTANLVIGFGKMIIQWFWDTLVFGKVSLAFSLSSFILHFVTAVSVVLFPSIKRIDEERLPAMYIQIRSVISPLFFLALLCYYPGSVILEAWLPKYAVSISYLGILMPIMVFTSKVSLLTNNYLKAYRKERLLLAINAIIVACAFVVFMLFGYFIRNITLMLLLIVATIMIRSFVSELAVAKIIKADLTLDLILETILTAIFIGSTMLFSRFLACIAYSVALVIYLSIKWNSLKLVFSLAKKILK